MAISKIFPNRTSGILQNFFTQSSSRQILQVALSIIAIGAAAIFYRKWNARTGPIITKPTDTTKSSTPPTKTSLDQVKKGSLASIYQKALNRYKATDGDYRIPSAPIPIQAKKTENEPLDSIVQARLFIEKAADGEGNIRLWNDDNPRKINKDEFINLAKQWVARGGKFVYPEEEKAISVDANTICMPWCHEGKNRSALVYDYLRRAGHQETLLPEGAKDGYLCPGAEVDADAVHQRYGVMKELTGFHSGKIVRSGEKLSAENADIQQGFTDLFNQLAKIKQPVMLFAFVSAVPILMREIMARTGNVDLNNITLVGFHHDDPMTVSLEELRLTDPWVLNNGLAETLQEFHLLNSEWKDLSIQNTTLRNAGRNEYDVIRQQKAARCKKISEQKAPLEATLLHYRRLEAVKEFQTAVLARLIRVQG